MLFNSSERRYIIIFFHNGFVCIFFFFLGSKGTGGMASDKGHLEVAHLATLGLEVGTVRELCPMERKQEHHGKRHHHRSEWPTCNNSRRF